jgi:hypothetical protein
VNPSNSKLLAATAALVVACGAVAPARASLIADGLTYTLTEAAISPTVEQFSLDITGINATGINGTSLDTEGGRYGVQSFAFNQPVGGLVTGSAPGFMYSTGGLNASGCNMHGTFFCFSANTTPSAPALAANSTLDITFTLTASSAGDFAGYNPGFKINWDGTRNNYDLVGQTLTPSVVPLPAALPLLLSGLAGLGFMRRRRAA